MYFRTLAVSSLLVIASAKPVIPEVADAATEVGQFPDTTILLNVHHNTSKSLIITSPTILHIVPVIETAIINETIHKIYHYLNITTRPAHSHHYNISHPLHSICYPPYHHNISFPHNQNVSLPQNHKVCYSSHHAKNITNHPLIARDSITIKISSFFSNTNVSNTQNGAQVEAISNVTDGQGNNYGNGIDFHNLDISGDKTMINSTGRNTGGQNGRMSKRSNGTDQEYHKREVQSGPPGIPNYWIEAVDREEKRSGKEQKLERELQRGLMSRWDDGDKTKISLLEEEIVMEGKRIESGKEWETYLKAELKKEVKLSRPRGGKEKREVEYRPKCKMEPCGPDRIELLEGALSNEKKRIAKEERVRRELADEQYKAKKSGSKEKIQMADEEHYMQGKRIELEKEWEDYLTKVLENERKGLLTGPADNGMEKRSEVNINVSTSDGKSNITRSGDNNAVEVYIAGGGDDVVNINVDWAAIESTIDDSENGNVVKVYIGADAVHVLGNNTVVVS